MQNGLVAQMGLLSRADYVPYKEGVIMCGGLCPTTVRNSEFWGIFLNKEIDWACEKCFGNQLHSFSTATWSILDRAEYSDSVKRPI